MNHEPIGQTQRAAVSLREAGRALREGAAVVVPNPAPLTHVITARRAPTVNEAKGRPADQPVALWAHHRDTLRALDRVSALDADRQAMARWLLSREHLTVLVPVRDRDDTPDWAAPAIRDGWMLLFGARWQPLRPLLDEQPMLYVSSANRTGRPPAATTADALAMFPRTVPVLAAPPQPGGPHRAVADPPRRATTTVRLHPDGRLELHRRGAQDERCALPDQYVRGLRARYAKATRGDGDLTG